MIGQTRHAQRARRQQLLLDLARRQHLLLHPRLLGVLPQQLGDLAGHHVERLGQLAELVARAHRNLMREVAIAQVLGAGEEVVHGAGDLPRQDEADHQRDELDDQEQHADEREHHEQQAGRCCAAPRAPMMRS